MVIWGGGKEEKEETRKRKRVFLLSPPKKVFCVVGSVGRAAPSQVQKRSLLFFAMR